MTPTELAELHAIVRQRRSLLRLVLVTVLVAGIATIVASLLATAETARAHAAVVAAATPAAAGDIVFTRQDIRGRSADLYTVNVDGGGLRRLTFTGNNFDPAFSPDGSRIAFASHRPGRAGPSEIYVMDANGTNVRRLTHSWRTRIGYTLNRHPTWSPDGSSIVYASTRTRVGRLSSTSSTDLFQVDVATRSTRNITNAAGVEAWPTYAADGSLLFVRNGTIYRRSGELDFFVRKGTDPALAPDNGYLAFVDNGGLFLTLGQGARKVADGTSPTWSSDGMRLVFAGRDGLRALTIGGGDGEITKPAAGFRHVTPTLRPTTST